MRVSFKLKHLGKRFLEKQLKGEGIIQIKILGKQIKGEGINQLKHIGLKGENQKEIKGEGIIKVERWTKKYYIKEKESSFLIILR